MSIDELQLIKNVRDHECLFNNKIYEYKHLQRKAAAWLEVSNNLNAKVSECKGKWSQLRNAFLHALTRRNGRNPKLFRKWKYENEMCFLLPFLSHGTWEGVLNARRTIEVNDQGDVCSETLCSDDNSNEEVTPERGIKRKNYCQEEIIQDKKQCIELIDEEDEDQEEEEFESNESHKVDYYREMFQLIKEKERR